MTQHDLDHIRTLRIELCLEAHLHLVQLGLTYGPLFVRHGIFTAAITAVYLDKDPYGAHSQSTGMALLRVLYAVQQHEELVLAHVQECGDDRDVAEIERAKGSFDLALDAYLDLAHRARISAGYMSPSEEIQRALSNRGLGDNVVDASERQGTEQRMKTWRRQRRQGTAVRVQAYTAIQFK